MSDDYLRKAIFKDASKIDPTRRFDVAVMLASGIWGPCADRIAKKLRVSRYAVRQLGHMLRDNKMWRGRKVTAEWFDKESGGTSIVMDLCVLDGLLERTETCE